MIDGGNEPLVLGLSGVVNGFHGVFFRISFTISIRVVVCFDPVHEFETHWVANLVIDKHLDFLLHTCSLIAIVFWCEIHSLRCCSIHLVGSLPITIGWHHMCWISLIVGLHLVGQPIWDINFRQVNADEEGTIVVRRVSRCTFNPAIARDSNVECAVLWSVFGVLEPHCTLEVERLTSSDPRVVWDVVHRQTPVVVTDLEPAQSKASVDVHRFRAKQVEWRITSRTAVVQTSSLESDASLVGEFSGHMENPVNFENTIVLHRPRRSIHFDVILRIIGAREDVAILPGHRRILGDGVGLQGKGRFRHACCVFTNDVSCDHFIWLQSFMQHFTNWNLNIEVDGVHGVGD